MSAAVVNLVSDTQTRPTEGMRAAMAGADVGDEQKLDDPTTIELQERVADLLGHEAALFLPSGTMCNLISCKLHVGPAGEEIILAANSHIASFEGGGAGAITHAMTRQIDAPTGIFSGAQVEAAVRPVSDRYSPGLRDGLGRADDQHGRREGMAARIGARDPGGRRGPRPAGPP